MIDSYLSFTVIATLMIVPLVSYVVSRMHTLPIDMVNAAASVIIFFVDAAARFISADGNTVTPQAILIMFLIFLLGVVFTASCLGIHVAIKNERHVKNISDEDMGTPYIEFGYCFSVLISVVFLIYSFTVAASVPVLFSKTAEDNESLFSVVGKIAISYPDVKLISVAAGIVYLVMLAMRYLPYADNLLRNRKMKSQTAEGKAEHE